MKTTGKWTLLALTPVLAAGLTAGSAFADGRGSHGEGFRRHGMRVHFSRRSHRGMRRMRHLGRMKETLGLTDDQVIKIKDIFTEARKKRIKTKAGIRVSRIEMRQLMRQEKIDRAAIDQKIQAISRLRTQAMRQRVDARLKVHSLLTPEQRKKARAMTFGPPRTEGPKRF